MADTLKGQRLTGGVRPSRSYGEGRTCKEQGCDTKISMYNRREFCHLHAPVKYPRVRGRILPEGT